MVGIPEDNAVNMPITDSENAALVAGAQLVELVEIIQPSRREIIADLPIALRH